MKKITLTLIASIAILFVSCDESDDAVTSKKVDPAARISPPAWIVGNWKVSGASIKGINFSKDDMCQVLVNNESLCYKEKIAIYNNAFLKNIVKETTTAANYDIEITLNDEIVEYHFEMIDSLNVNWNVLDKEDPNIIKNVYRMSRPK